MANLESRFIEFCIRSDVLRFGEFLTKAGRLSPYFFNAGLFNKGSTLAELASYYAGALLNAEKAGKVKCDMIFGPAYKGITLAAATAIRLSEAGRDLPYAYNRKEKKDHGEGGSVVGAKLEGNVLIVDDVISAGTSVSESIEIIRANGANPCGVLIALDRMERAGNAVEVGERSAVQEVEKRYGIPVVAIATLADLMRYLETNESPQLRQHAAAVWAYRERYGV